jgi:hypothetical protein
LVTRRDREDVFRRQVGEHMALLGLILVVLLLGAVAP